MWGCEWAFLIFIITWQIGVSILLKRNRSSGRWCNTLLWIMLCQPGWGWELGSPERYFPHGFRLKLAKGSSCMSFRRHCKATVIYLRRWLKLDVVVDSGSLLLLSWTPGPSRLPDCWPADQKQPWHLTVHHRGRGYTDATVLRRILCKLPLCALI